MLIVVYTHPFFFFFFNDPAPPEISTLPLHDALPISPPLPDGRGSPHTGREHEDEPAPAHRRRPRSADRGGPRRGDRRDRDRSCSARAGGERSEEHTSELQSQSNLVCRLLLEKKKTRR